MRRCLWRAYKEAFACREVRNSDEALQLAVTMPCRRYWISTKEAARQISRLEKGLGTSYRSAHKREIIKCVYARYKELRGRYEFQGMSIRFVTSYAVNSPAPQFYISVRTARRALSFIRKKGG